MRSFRSIPLAVCLIAGASACGDSSPSSDAGGDAALDTGAPGDAALDTGAPSDAALDTGLPGDAALDTGLPGDAGLDTGPPGDAASGDASMDGGAFLAPLCYHSLDDIAGTVADHLGGYDLDDVSGSVTYEEPGQVGDAMSFRAGGVASSTALYAAREDVSVSLWFKTDAASAPATVERLWGWGNATPSRFILSMNPDGQLRVYVERSGNGGLNHTLNLATGNLADGNWHHVVVRRERIPDPAGTNRVDAFVDGAVAPVSAQSPDGEDFEFHNSQPFVLGAGSGNPFQGTLDEIAVFDYALSEPERQAAWTRGSAGQPLLE